MIMSILKKSVGLFVGQSSDRIINYLPKGQNWICKSKIRIDQAWAGNKINMEIFRYQALLVFKNKQIAAYYDKAKRLVIVERDLLSHVYKLHVIATNCIVTDSHNVISLGVDSFERLHIVYGCHSQQLNYISARIAPELHGWVTHKRMTGLYEEKVTYPMFLNNPITNELIFIYRYGVCDKGAIGIKRLASDGAWTDDSSFIFSGLHGEPCGPYINTPVYDSFGRLHCAVVWRAPQKKGESLVNNHGIGYVYSDDNGKNWKNQQQQTMSLPITKTSVAYIYLVPVRSNLINQSGMAVDQQGHAHIVFYSNDANGVPQYQHIFYDGKHWQHQYLSKRTRAFQLAGSGTLRLPMTRSAIIIDHKNRAHILFQADFTDRRLSAISLYPPSYSIASATFDVLVDQDLGYSEPILDYQRWARSNQLTLLVQKTNQPNQDRGIFNKSADIFIVDLTLSDE